jgi:fructokinase
VTTPVETLANVQAFFTGQITQRPLRAIGVASFGPLDLDEHSETYGYITTTPKPHWSNIDLVGPLRKAFGLPVGFDTDVNGAALGEYRWGAAQGLRDFLYLTVGAGIGGGGMLNGSLMHGLVHPEMGHMRVPHDHSADSFKGACPYHGDCLEGLASGPAIAARTGRPAEELPGDHQVWQLVARYLAHGLANLILALSPQRIILGGGVMRRHHLFAMIRREVQALLNGYVPHRTILEEINAYIVPPALGERAGVLGAVALAQMAAKNA